MSNHVTNWDPFLVGLSFRKSMYYVATDHIFRMGFVSRIIDFLVSPIPRLKTAHETQTVISIFRRLKDNCNVCIFAEGNSSFDGKTGEIPYSIGKLVKRSGAALVTYRLSGGYFSFPRWARFYRKGKITGKLIGVYDPKTLTTMSEDEIYAAIKSDLNGDAYEDQKKDPVAFRGKRPAEYLETALYCCPGCKKFSTLKSENDRLFCGCGFSARFNEHGYFETPKSGAEGRGSLSGIIAGQTPLATITEWVEWQRNEIERLARTMQTFDGNTAVFRDPGQTLFEVVRVRRNIELARGALCLYNNKISFAGDSGKTFDFPFEKIAEMSIITMMKLIFTSGSSGEQQKVYEVHSDHPRSALKYLDMFQAWRNLARRNG